MRRRWIDVGADCRLLTVYNNDKPGRHYAEYGECHYAMGLGL
jgi:hypothetical protein